MLNETTPTAAHEAAVGVSRIALGVEYKGSNYHDLQLLPAGTPGIQGPLEAALRDIKAVRPARLR